MSTLNNVFKKLEHTDKIAKVNLESQKVELNSIDALKKIISNGNSIYKRGVEFIDKKTALTKEAKTLNADAKALLTGGEKLINQFVNSAKELGINTSGIKELEDAINILGVLNTVEKQSQSL